MIAESPTMVTENVPALVQNTSYRPKVLLADDHLLILDALHNMMSSQFRVLTVDNSQGFLEAVETFEPNIAILDVNMPGGDGFTTAKKVLEKRPELLIVFLSMYTEPPYIEKAAELGAKAYLSKAAPAQELITAIYAVLQGDVLLPVPSGDGTSFSPQDTSKGGLTTRQREVLRLIALGSSAKDIANQLNISVRTAEFHRAAIMQRLGLHSTAQMTRYAISQNIA